MSLLRGARELRAECCRCNAPPFEMKWMTQLSKLSNGYLNAATSTQKAGRICKIHDHAWSGSLVIRTGSPRESFGILVDVNVQAVAHPRLEVNNKMQTLRGTRVRACRCAGSGYAPLRVQRVRHSSVVPQAAMKALVFDCDGVILESEDLHRRAYNATFQHFDVRCGNAGVVDWTEEFYDVLQNTVGGGKPKMRWYFGRKGWPTSSIFNGRTPSSEQEQAQLIDTLQDWKTEKYQQMIGSGEVQPRPGVLRLMDEARAAGMLLAVCSAATKSSVVYTLKSLLGEARFGSLDCFLAGDDVDKKKPDPTIYNVAASRLGVSPSDCVVVEDSMIGLQAAMGAGMRCIITYTPSTKSQDFKGADAIMCDLDGHSRADHFTIDVLQRLPFDRTFDDRTFPGAERIVSDLASSEISVKELQERRIVQDDRLDFTVTDSAIMFHIPGQ